jgi:propanol-preferring alcohol dehydrogenase
MARCSRGIQILPIDCLYGYQKVSPNNRQPDNVTIPFQELIFRDIRLRGTLVCSAQEANDMLQLVAKHDISVNTNAFKGLGEIEKLIELAESGKMKGKGIVIMDQSQIDAEGKGVV